MPIDEPIGFRFGLTDKTYFFVQLHIFLSEWIKYDLQNNLSHFFCLFRRKQLVNNEV